MPLIAYLDTQDYISAFNEKDSGPNLSVLTELKMLRDQGLVQLGFSFAIVIEFVTKPDDHHRDERVRRGALIKDVCGPNAFPMLSDLSSGAKFPNAGHWATAPEDRVVSARDFRLKAAQGFRQRLMESPQLNRSERRRLKSIGHEQLLRQGASTWGRNRTDYGGIPVSDELIESRLIERFLKGQCSDQEFEDRMSRWFTDPEEFSRIYYDYGNKDNAFSEFFGETQSKITATITRIESYLAALQEANSTILDARSQLVEAGVDRREARKLTKQLSLPEFDPSQVTERLEDFLGRDRVGHFGHYLKKVISGAHRYKPSDAMDLFHFCYAYDCDLFRCDKAMAHAFADFEPFAGKLVRNLRELPIRIREKSGI